MLIPGALILTNISPVPGDDRGRSRKGGRRRRRTNRRTNEPPLSEGKRQGMKTQRDRGLREEEEDEETEPLKARRSSPPWRQLPLSVLSSFFLSFLLSLFVRISVFLSFLLPVHTRQFVYNASRILRPTVVFGRASCHSKLERFSERN